MSKRTRTAASLLIPIILAAAACSDTADPTGEAAVLLSVSPSGGETNADPNSPIVIEFNHAMGIGMEMHVALHTGSDVSGGVVEGMWDWSHDRMTVTFTPSAPLTSQASYTIHIGGGMTDDHGNLVDLEQHGGGMGGHVVTQQMMDDRMMMGGGLDDMMGPGWKHPTDGTYGMRFTFTTG